MDLFTNNDTPPKVKVFYVHSFEMILKKIEVLSMDRSRIYCKVCHIFTCLNYTYKCIKNKKDRCLYS